MLVRVLRRCAAVGSCLAMLVAGGPLLAQEAGAGPGQSVGPGPAAPGAVEPLDPVMQAILLAMTARVLREAAADPDPLEALGRTLERSVAAAAADPRTLRTIEALTAQALKDAPPELRQALLQFIVGALERARRDRASASR